MKTGNTRLRGQLRDDSLVPQWSPVMKTGNTLVDSTLTGQDYEPQWSPVMKTGNTRRRRRGRAATDRLNGARS